MSDSIPNPMSETCMLVSMQISCWLGRRSDRKASVQTALSFKADAGSGTYSKFLVPQKALTQVHATAHLLREAHNRFTLPWLDGGIRVLASKAYWKYLDATTKAREAYEAEVSSFVGRYPTLVASAQQHLGGLFNPMDYPRDVRAKFGSKMQFLPFPSAQDFRVQGLNGATEGLRQNIAEIQEQVSKAAVVEACDRIRVVVSNIAGRLRDYTGRKDGAFRDSMILNARELCEILPLINVNEDQRIKDLSRKLEEISAVDPQDLREDDALRSSTADAAQEILDKMADFI